MPLIIEIEDVPTPPQKFKGGDLIKGKVVLVNNSGKPRLLSQDLSISFIGKASSSWKEPRRHATHMRQYLITVWDEELYFNESIILQNEDPSIQGREIPPGTSIYPFQFQLPLGIPESYLSSNGNVIYAVEVNYPCSWNWTLKDQLIRKEFYVGGHLDLNCCCPALIAPGYFTMEKKFWLGLGKVRTKLYLPRRGFCAGETVDFSLEVYNDSRWYLKKIRVYFCQVTTYYAKESEYKEGARLVKIKCKPVHPKEAKNIEGSIMVPFVPPSGLGGCRLINPSYGIQIKVIATTLGKMVKSVVLEGRVPILIGTVPSTQPLSTSVRVIRTTPMEQQSSDVLNGTEDGQSMDADASVDEFSMQRAQGEAFTNLCVDGDGPFENPPSYEEALSGSSTPVPSHKETLRTSVYSPPVDTSNLWQK